MSRYSVDYLKYQLFDDEIRNVLELVDVTYRDEEYQAVLDYLEKRKQEIKKELEKNGQ